MDNVNRLTKQVSVFAVGFIAFFALLGYAGSEDYAQDVISSMSIEAYESICAKLGESCTDRQIAREYMDNRKYYDSLGY